MALIDARTENLKELEEARKILHTLATDDKIKLAAAKLLVDVQKSLTAWAFSEQSDPDKGTKWPAPKHSTEQDKRFKGLMNRSGHLRQSALNPDVSITAKDGTYNVKIDMPRDPYYAEFHQFGTSSIHAAKGGQVYENKRTKRLETAYHRGTNTPARPFFALTRDFTSRAKEKVDKVLQVTFEAYSNSFYSRAIKLPRAELPGYTSVVSFYHTAPQGQKISRSTRAVSHIIGDNGRNPIHGPLVRMDSRAHEKLHSLKTLKFREDLTESIRPVKVKKPPKERSRNEKTQRRHELRQRMQELSTTLEQRAERFRHSALYKQLRYARLEERRQLLIKFKDDRARALERIRLANGPEAKIAAQQAYDAMLNEYRKKGFVFAGADREINLRKSVERWNALQREKFLESYNKRLKKEAGYKTPGRKPLSPAEKAASEAAAKLRRAQRNKEREAERAEKRERDREKIARQLAKARANKAVPVNTVAIKRFYSGIKSDNVEQQGVMESIYRHSQEDVRVPDAVKKFHQVHYTRAKARIEDIQKKAKGVQGTAAQNKAAREQKQKENAAKAEQKKQDKAAEAQRKKQEAEAERVRKKQAAEAEAQRKKTEPKPSKLDEIPLTAEQKAHNKRVNGQLTALRAQKRAAKKAGNTEMAEHLEGIIKELELTKHSKTYRSADLNAAQKQRQGEFVRQIDNARRIADLIHSRVVALRSAIDAIPLAPENTPRIKALSARLELMKKHRRQLHDRMADLEDRFRNLKDAPGRPKVTAHSTGTPASPKYGIKVAPKRGVKWGDLPED